MQPSPNNLQFQQMQILQQQQRLANMMQQNQRGYPRPHPQQAWEDNNLAFKQQQKFLQQQQQQLHQQQQHQLHQQQQQQLQQQQQQRMAMAQPHTIPQPTIPPKQPMPPQAAAPVANAPLSAPPIERAIPVKTVADKKNLEQYQERDEHYQNTLNLQHKRHIELAQSKKRSIESASMERKIRMQQGSAVAFGPGYRGYGNGKTGMLSRIRFPYDKRKGRPGKREKFYFSSDALKNQAEKEDVLVPIRIELEHEGYKLRDTFTWNLNETLVTPEQFANVICDDLKLPTQAFSDQIARSIKEQIDDYNLNASSMVKDDNEEGNDHFKLETTDSAIATTATPSDAAEEDKSSEINHGSELRTIIKLDITVGNWELIDQFEWDIGCPRNSPEEFAQAMATDMGLSGEFKTAIAHSIREQIHVYIKSLLLVGYEFNGASIADEDIKSSFLPRLQSIIREGGSVERFTPSMIELSDLAIAKLEKDRMREARRKRRGTRARRGVVLPDREPQKTYRTGFAVPPEQEMTDEQFMQSQLAEGNKRSAALKARLNIAAEAAQTVDDLIDESNVGGGGGSSLQNTIAHNTLRINEYQRQLMQQKQQMNAWQQQPHLPYR